MQTKKIIGVALVAGLVSTMAAVSVAARDEIPADEVATYFNNHKIGIVGGFTNWGNPDETTGAVIPDVQMTDADGDGIFVGVVRNVTAGDYEFKVRADSAWDDSWGEYEADYDRTMNSQTNCKVTVKGTSDIIVTLDTTGDDNVTWPVKYYSTETLTASKYGIVGSPTNWGNADEATGNVIADVPLYEITTGKYVGVLKDVAAGDQEFKVRADSAWDESYGAYEEDYDRTNNSQTNVKVTLADTADIAVEFDTTGSDNITWPITYTVYNADGTVTAVYTGKEKENPQHSTDESSTEESSKKDQSSTGDNEKSQVSKLSDYKTTQKDYIFFDNSQTKWDKVYAYWWNTDFTKVIDLEGNLYGSLTTDENGETVQDFGSGYPGIEMQQVKGTDIWQARIPFGATKIIFNSGVSDEDVKNGVEAYQTVDLDFDAEANAGQIYTIDTSVEPTPGRGVEKTKYKYGEGSWTDYEGEFISETLNPKNLVSNPAAEVGNGDDESSEDTETIDGHNDTNAGTGTGAGITTTDAPQTGDVAMAVAFISVAAAALGAVVLATKKRERN